MSKIQVVEVGLRDGLQNEKTFLPVTDRFKIIEWLSESGLKRIELGSFTSPKAVPQMKCIEDFARQVLKAQNRCLKQIMYSAFTPNLKGFENARHCGLKEVSLFVACTESFSKKNINMTVKESFKNLKQICRKARALKIKVRVYLSAVFACPYEGDVSQKKAVQLAYQIMQEDVFEISLSDTAGSACPLDVKKVLQSVSKKIPIQKIALHFHDTRGLALANTLAGLEQGVKVFDSSVGGLGGCPFAPSAGGNTATEDLVYMLDKMKYKTQIDLEKLKSCTRFLEKKLGRRLPAHFPR